MIYSFLIHLVEIDGGYSEWLAWTPCQGKCGMGTQLRERTCTNPEPVGTGKDCSSLGETTEIKSCDTGKKCPGTVLTMGKSRCHELCFTKRPVEPMHQKLAFKKFLRKPKGRKFVSKRLPPFQNSSSCMLMPSPILLSFIYVRYILDTLL